MRRPATANLPTTECCWRRKKGEKGLRANYHTHTWRCNHATGSEQDYVEQALAAGMEELGFSDHSPYPFADGHDSGFRMKLEQTADYFKTLEQLR